MTLLLAGDEYCAKFNGLYYVRTTGMIFIQRYLNAFERVVVAFRTREVDSKSDLGKHNILVEDERVRFIHIPFFQGPTQLIGKCRDIKRAIKDGIGECDFAIVRLPSATAFMALGIVRKKNIDYATEIVFDCKDAEHSSTSLIHKMIWRMMHCMQKEACNEALGVSCVTESYLQQRYFPKRKEALVCHYSSIEMTPDFYYHVRKHPENKVIRIIHVANQVQFNSRKGHNQLIEVLARLKRDGKKAEIYFVGEDYFGGVAKLTNYAKKFGVEESVFFPGYLSKDELRIQLEEADIAILPTKAEGLPRTVIEAMALGLPCITSPVSGNLELIDSEFLIDYDDIEGMAQACEKLISSLDIYEKESKKNFQKSKKYSTEVLNPRRTKFYNDLIGLSKKLKSS